MAAGRARAGGARPDHVLRRREHRRCPGVGDPAGGDRGKDVAGLRAQYPLANDRPGDLRVKPGRADRERAFLPPDSRIRSWRPVTGRPVRYH